MKKINHQKLLKNEAHESKLAHESTSIKLKKLNLKTYMKINESKDELKFNVLEEEVNVIGRVEGLKRFIQHIMDLMLHKTKPSDMSHVT